MNTRLCGALTALIMLTTSSFSSFADSSNRASVDRGRYLVHIAGCNDCHTAGYGASGGNIPQSEWLKGDIVGWRGPWGTTYAPNLRLSLSALTEGQWVTFARHLSSRPPMPWFNLNAMTEEDLQSIYRFIKQLQPLGDPAPTYVPPGVEPNTPYVLFPATPEGSQSAHVFTTGGNTSQ